jgi:hypothetical protein
MPCRISPGVCVELAGLTCAHWLLNAQGCSLTQTKGPSDSASLGCLNQPLSTHTPHPQLETIITPPPHTIHLNRPDNDSTEWIFVRCALVSCQKVRSWSSSFQPLPSQCYRTAFQVFLCLFSPPTPLRTLDMFHGKVDGCILNELLRYIFGHRGNWLGVCLTLISRFILINGCRP